MSDKTYNGWTNYETWCVKLWLDNEQGSQEWMNEIVLSYPDNHEAATALRDGLADNMPDLGATLWADLLRSAFDEVNWREIAENVREDIDED